MKRVLSSWQILAGWLWCAGLLGWGGASLADEVDDFMKAEMEQQRIPGAAVVVMRSGEIAKAKAYGFVDLERGSPTSTDSVFRISSMTKPFTAMAVMMLAEEGKIDIDAPVGRYLSDCPESWSRITVRNLLNQTSGLPDFINNPTRDLNLPASDKELMASFANRPLKFEPGNEWNYSNSNYLLLGMIIERASGKWYGEFLADRVFRPLGMTRTSVPRNRDQRPRGYTLDKGEIRPSIGDTLIAETVLSYAGGGIQSTVMDLAKWDAALESDKLLKRSTLEQMWTPARLNSGALSDYGFGWTLAAIGGHPFQTHGGRWTGFTSEIDRFVQDKITIIILTNQADADTGRLERGIAGKFIPDLAPRTYAPIPDKEPTITERFKDLLRRGAAGRLRADEFTESSWKYLAQRVDKMAKDFTDAGALKSLVLVERSEAGGERSYRYLATFDNGVLVFHFTLDADSKVGMMAVDAVNP